MRGWIQRGVQIAVGLHLGLQRAFPRLQRQHAPGLVIQACQDAVARVPVQHYLLHEQRAHVPAVARVLRGACLTPVMGVTWTYSCEEAFQLAWVLVTG